MPRGVHSVYLGSKGRSSETAVEAVLSAPGRALTIEIEAVSAPGMTDEVVDRTKTIEGAGETTVEQGVKALPGSGGRGDLERRVRTCRADELFIAFIRTGATREHHSYRPVAGVSSEEGEQVIRFHLELPVSRNHLGIAMSAPRL